MKDIKYRFEQFAFYDHDAIKERLEAMALQGWLIEKPGNFIWRYRRIEPKKLHVAVTYFPNASEFDPGPTEGQQMMEQFAKKDGWKIAARWGQMQIFYNEAEEPTPIETDAVTQVETIHRAMRKNMLPTHFILLALCIYQLCFSVVDFIYDSVDFLSAPASLYMVPSWILILIPIIIEICFYFSWYKKAKTIAEERDEFLSIKRNHAGSYILLLLSLLIIIIAFVSSGITFAAMLIWIVVMGVIIFTVNMLKNRMKRKGVSRNLNRFMSIGITFILTLIFIYGVVFIIIRYGTNYGRTPVGTYEHYGTTLKIYDDPLPLEIEDIMDIDGQWSKEARGNETIFVSDMRYNQRSIFIEENEGPDLSYRIIDVKVPFLYDFCKESLLNEYQDEVYDDYIFYNSYFTVDASDWNAGEVYQLRWSDSILNTYLVCWENRIVEIKFYWEPTKEQIAKVAEILGK